MFSVLILYSIFYSSFVVCSTAMQKEFTLERIMTLNDHALLNSVLRLQNNRTKDEVTKDRSYTVNIDLEELRVESLSQGSSTNFILLQPENQTKEKRRLFRLFPGVLQHYIRIGTRPNFIFTFNEDELPEECKNLSKFPDLPELRCIVAFLQECSNPLLELQQSNSRCLRLIKTIQDCIMQ